MTVLTLQFFDAASKQSERVAIDTRLESENKAEKSIRCRTCGHVITSESEKITVNQLYQHTCKNPSGFVYTFGCFRSAPGCIAVGPASYEHTWFAGYSWQIVVCTNCREHLGWLFSNHDKFFALITDRLKYD